MLMLLSQSPLDCMQLLRKAHPLIGVYQLLCKSLSLSCQRLSLLLLPVADHGEELRHWNPGQKL